MTTELPAQGPVPQGGRRITYRRQMALIGLVSAVTLGMGWIGPLGWESGWRVSLAATLLAVPLCAWLAVITHRAQRQWMQAEEERASACEKQRRLETILEIDPEGVLVLDRARRVVHINPAGCALIAAAFPEEVVGKSLDQFVHPDDHAAFERGHDAAFQGRGVVATGRLLGFSGAVRWVDMTAVSLPTGGEAGVSVLCVFRDITEQRRSDRRQALQHAVAKVLAESSSVEQALPDLLRAVAAALDWSVGLLWQVRDEPPVLACTQTWTRDPSVAQDVLARCRERTFASGVGLPGRCWARGEPQWIGDMRGEPDGSGPQAALGGLRAACAFPVWLRANVYGVMEFFSEEAHPSDPELLRALGIIGSQIGLFLERTEVEGALRENESRTRLIIDTALDAVIAMDVNGVITEWNSQAETMFGWTHHEAVGRDLADTIIPPVYRAAHRAGLARFCQTGTATVFNKLIEIVGLRRDGREFPIELAIAPLRLDGTVSFSAFIRDITARKESEKAVTDYAQQLERINHQLDAALREAQAATEAKSAFLATMSHEIRTPMNGIIGMTGLLLDTALTEEQREYGETVRCCGDHLLMLIDDILDFSKIEAGKLSLERIDFDLRVAVEDALELLAERASSKGLNLACLFHADVPRGVVGDPGRLRQILMNLAGNAIKFTDRGDVVLQVTVEEQSERAAAIRIAITDTGIGIAEDAQQRLFQSFSQADASTTRKYGGTGLGLAICKRLVELMGGAIGVTSRPGEGSCFWFTVRLDKSAGVAAGITRSLERLQGRRALIVDDKAVNRAILVELLNRWGMHPTPMVGGPAVRDWIAQQQEPAPFDLALLDADMGSVDGLALARAMKADPRWAGVRLVLLTSLGRRGDAAAAREAGLAAYLTKPIRESHLYEALVAALDASPPAAGRPSGDRHHPPLVTRHTVAEARAGAHIRILLAEDNVINQKVAVRLFERLGYRVDLVANGAEAVEAAGRLRYDLIFMDCQMPEMDGFEATRRIRDREQRDELRATSDEPEQGSASTRHGSRVTHHVPIIAMTANAMEGDRERCLAAGMDEYLSKPIMLETLAAVLDRRLSPVRHDPAMNREEPAIDPLIFQGLRELGGDDAPEFLPALIGQFLKDVPESMNQMRAARDAGDLREMGRLAHRLKGSAGHLGALAMAKLCERAQRAADLADADQCGRLLAELNRELIRVRAALEQAGAERASADKRNRAA
ncbi:response regulator [Nitrospira moscoviensis]|nr:response regulator [Nitrospira moscoviensis]